jgi:hypothetical protein
MAFAPISWTLAAKISFKETTIESKTGEHQISCEIFRLPFVAANYVGSLANGILESQKVPAFQSSSVPVPMIPDAVHTAPTTPTMAAGTDAAPAASVDTQEAGNGFLNLRATTLQSELTSRRWTKHDLARETDVDHRTIKKVLNGQNVVDNTIDKLRLTIPNLP